MKRENWTVTETSTRPAGEPDRCFYCGRLLGEQHKDDCVIKSKTVVVDFTVRTVLSVPESWDENQINYHYNDGTWCADNLLNELDNRNNMTQRCLCDITSAKFVKEADEKEELAYGVTFVKELES
ncbi:hypothetical protein [Clostridium sp. HBUAS56010]|uniref:hypothetical protein n=1 Tax=Clostridium sp. HBUAS56010 TaxID=2571127 RepID=UPI0011787DA2|nr:hypothetical protein [Clostridium sp. HBUAS56010]